MSTESRRVVTLPHVTLVREVGTSQSTSTPPYNYVWQLVGDPGENLPSEIPVSHPYGDWTEATAENATHALLDLTVWSDYSGSTVERSNERSLLADYPGVFIQVYGRYGTSGLLLPVDMPPSFRADDDQETREEWWQYLLDELAALESYPVISEEDLSELESELANEAWDDYLKYDIPSDLEKRGVSDDKIEENLDTIRERFYELTWEADYGPEAESAVNVVFPFYEQTLDTIGQELS